MCVYAEVIQTKLKVDQTILVISFNPRNHRAAARDSVSR